ncbi:hypothetical protein TNCV_1426611 [Trichonephila clavipes]|nr:hypothetical protein TNCV_1426611 [Trichonephila clavipes]
MFLSTTSANLSSFRTLGADLQAPLALEERNLQLENVESPAYPGPRTKRPMDKQALSTTLFLRYMDKYIQHENSETEFHVVCSSSIIIYGLLWHETGARVEIKSRQQYNPVREVGGGNEILGSSKPDWPQFTLLRRAKLNLTGLRSCSEMWRGILARHIKDSSSTEVDQ